MSSTATRSEPRTTSVAVTGSITGTPIVFKTRGSGYRRSLTAQHLYECSVPDEMAYEQQRAQFRLELGAASRAEACLTKDGKKYRGKISDISETEAVPSGYAAASRLSEGTALTTLNYN